MTYIYWERDKTDHCYYKYFTDKKLLTYPYAIRFENNHDLDKYLTAKNQFIQSTKIPEDSCDNCPLSEHICDLEIPYGGNRCRKTWRKIWEHVK